MIKTYIEIIKLLPLAMYCFFSELILSVGWLFCMTTDDVAECLYNLTDLLFKGINNYDD